MRRRWQPRRYSYRTSLAVQSVAPGNCFAFDPDRIFDGNDGVRGELKLGKHRAKLVNRQGIVALHQQMPAPVADAHDEKLDVEIGWRFPVTNTSRIRFWACSYSMGEPCGRSNQLIMYFMSTPYCHWFDRQQPLKWTARPQRGATSKYGESVVASPHPSLRFTTTPASFR